MFDALDFFKYTYLRRYLRGALVVGKWAMRLLSASIEAYLRSNFGRRYLHMLASGFFAFFGCYGLDPSPTFLGSMFLLILFALIFHHYIQAFRRPHLSIPEPHSSSAGDSWHCWKCLGISENGIKRYFEPALCGMVGLIVSIIDHFLGRWLLASAIALFIKEQVSLWKINCRIIDSLDAKLEAQRLNASLAQFQQKPGQGAQKSHRVHYPRSGQRPPP